MAGDQISAISVEKWKKIWGVGLTCTLSEWPAHHCNQLNSILVFWGPSHELLKSQVQFLFSYLASRIIGVTDG